MAPLLGYLRELGAARRRRVVHRVAVGGAAERYRRHLAVERGLSASTVSSRVRRRGAFWRRWRTAGRSSWAGSASADVKRYVLASASRRSRGHAKGPVCALRSLLGFLLEGLIERSLAGAVPSAARGGCRGCRARLSPNRSGGCWTSCDRATGTGRRDFAILMLLARLGLRAGEVAGLGLDDVDWRAGELVVLGKGRRAERLPLPVDVGEAMAAYLRDGRPGDGAGPERVRARQGAAPAADHRRDHAGRRSPPATRAGLGQIHAHRLRHTAATEMLQGRARRWRRSARCCGTGAALTTAIYAKVDRDARRWRELARPRGRSRRPRVARWPGGAR